MTDEEKKAIDNLRFNCTNVGFSVYDGTTRMVKCVDIQTALEIIEKQEKVIDEMVDRIEWLMKSNGIMLDFEHKDNFAKEDIKQYFYRKVKTK